MSQPPFVHQGGLNSCCSSGKKVTVDGKTLSIAALVAVSRYQASTQLDSSPKTKEKVDKSRNTIADKVDNGISVYGNTIFPTYGLLKANFYPRIGVNTGFGGSAGMHLYPALRFQGLTNTLRQKPGRVPH